MSRMPYYTYQRCNRGTVPTALRMMERLTGRVNGALRDCAFCALRCLASDFRMFGKLSLSLRGSVNQGTLPS
jgi:hypothetical protein